MRWGGKSLDSAMTKIRGLDPRACHLEALFADLRESAPVRSCILLRFGRLSVEFARFRFGGHPAQPALFCPGRLASRLRPRVGQGRARVARAQICSALGATQPSPPCALPCPAILQMSVEPALASCPGPGPGPALLVDRIGV